ncbi:uncharacterized protein LOC111674287 [Orussus abietinus]|uniref:uncharacterized protein LOC111674287 n=1 Tax=Orussus abietinus TaxID=222816 RepID=UPI000C715AF8|nr:uncharacterized protein LOC111674287 [Orussus abietinus]
MLFFETNVCSDLWIYYTGINKVRYIGTVLGLIFKRTIIRATCGKATRAPCAIYWTLSKLPVATVKRNNNRQWFQRMKNTILKLKISRSNLRTARNLSSCLYDTLAFRRRMLYIAALDVGTTTVRCHILDEQATTIATSTEKVHIYLFCCYVIQIRLNPVRINPDNSRKRMSKYIMPARCFNY